MSDQDTTVTTTTSTLTSEAALDDTLATNRTLPVTPAAQIPGVPAAYRATDGDVRRRRLRRLEANLFAQALSALAEVAARGALVAQDLGKYVPDPARAAALLARL